MGSYEAVNAILIFFSANIKLMKQKYLRHSGLCFNRLVLSNSIVPTNNLYLCRKGVFCEYLQVEHEANLIKTGKIRKSDLKKVNSLVPSFKL